MAFVSITRLRIRSIAFLPPFVWHALKSGQQAKRTPGFLGGRLMREPGNIFWTMTAWVEDEAMNAFRVGGAHGSVMPRLLDWCDEASVAHWTQETRELPPWQDAYVRLIRDGRPSKVKHPSPAHLSHQLPAPRPGRLDRRLEPAGRS
jgi:hypothetical protein